MKIKLLSAGLLLSVTVVSFAQNAKDILTKSYHKCQSIQNGYFEMDTYTKWMSEKDTSKSSYTCYFKKLKNDSLSSLAFHYKHIERGYKAATLYTGNELVHINPYDSTATIKSKALWGEHIKAYYGYINWSHFVTREFSPLPHDANFTDNKHIFKFIGEEAVNKISCYHIQMNEIPKVDSTEMMKTLRIESHFWIKKEDFIPVQYSIAYDLVMQNDTMYEYNKVVLTKYELNKLKDESIFTLSSIPASYRIKDYVAIKSPEPLPKDTIAPNFKLLSVTEEEISLADQKGKLVLLDFFYKSCYPCMQALPKIQALHEKYKDKGLSVIGIDPWDKKEDGMAAFLTKRGATYPVLLGAKEVANDYRVSGYPTLYLIDKTGKIILIQVGYDEDIERTLEEVIMKNL